MRALIDVLQSGAKLVITFENEGCPYFRRVHILEIICETRALTSRRN